MSLLTLDLPDNVKSELEAAGREANQTPEAYAANVLQRAVALRRFRTTRQAILNRLGTDAPSEQSILDDIS